MIDLVDNKQNYQAMSNNHLVDINLQQIPIDQPVEQAHRDQQPHDENVVVPNQPQIRELNGNMNNQDLFVDMKIIHRSCFILKFILFMELFTMPNFNLWIHIYNLLLLFIAYHGMVTYNKKAILCHIGYICVYTAKLIIISTEENQILLPIIIYAYRLFLVGYIIRLYNKLSIIGFDKSIILKSGWNP